MAGGTCSISVWAHASSPCTQGSTVSAGQARLWALSREEGETGAGAMQAPAPVLHNF